MAAPHVLAIVLAGGEGKRLMPLTADRAKPAVPFGGLYRLVDFALSNLVNSRYLQIIVLTQYKSHSLDRHVARTWRMSPLLGNYVAPVPAQQRVGKHWYLGSADAIYQCLNIIRDEGPDIVADDVQALVDSVRAAQVPVLADPLLGRDGSDVVPPDRGHPPGPGHVPVQAVRLVLGQHDDLQVPGVHQVRQREVDQPVEPSEGHRGLGAIGGERHESLTLTAGEDDGQDVGR